MNISSQIGLALGGKAVMYDSKNIIVYGGSSYTEGSDSCSISTWQQTTWLKQTWVLNLQTWAWRQLNASPGPATSSHAMALVGSVLYSFGGWALGSSLGYSSFQQTMWSLNLSDLNPSSAYMWTQRWPPAASTASTYYMRKGHTMVSNIRTDTNVPYNT